MASKDCFATVTPGRGWDVDACNSNSDDNPPAWYKISAVIDGAFVPGYSTLSSGNTATSAAISVFLEVVCTVLNLMFCYLEQISRAHTVLTFVSHQKKTHGAVT